MGSDIFTQQRDLMMSTGVNGFAKNAGWYDPASLVNKIPTLSKAQGTLHAVISRLISFPLRLQLANYSFERPE